MLNVFYYLGFLLSFLIPMSLATNFTLNHFYVYGGYVEDSGWFAYLTTHATSWPLTNPPVLIDKFGESFFKTHMSLIFYLLTAIYNFFTHFILDIPYVFFFSLTQGLWFGLLSLGCYCVFIPLGRNKQYIQIVLAFVFSQIVMVNGISLATLVSFHIEIAAPALLLIFFALRGNGFRKTSYVPLIIALLVREDIGLHYFCIFFLLAMIANFSYPGKLKSQSKNFFHLSLLCLVYSVVIIALQHYYFHPDTLGRIYMSENFYSHVNDDFLTQRFHFIFERRSYLYVPLLTLLLFSIVCRDALRMAGFLFALPWIVFSCFAFSPMAGTLSFYYAFPTLIALLWPAIIFSINKNENTSKYYYLLFWCEASFIIALSCILFFLSQSNMSNKDKIYRWDYYQFPWERVGFQWIEHWRENQEILDYILKLNLLGENYIVDTSIVAIELDKIHKNHYLIQGLSASQVSSVNFVIYQGKLKPKIRQIIKKAGLNKTCQFKNTDYFLVEKKDGYPDLC